MNGEKKSLTKLVRPAIVNGNDRRARDAQEDAAMNTHLLEHLARARLDEARAKAAHSP